MSKMVRSLGIWMNDDRVATWSVRSGVHELVYDDLWVTSSRGRPLSLSLPFLPANASHRGESVRHYFENLLPDRPEVRNRLRDRFGAASAGGFDLLSEVGRDCVGAVQILPIDLPRPSVKTIEGEPLTDSEVAQQLRQAGGLRVPGFGYDDFRLSLAGAQEKTAFLRHNDRWFRPRGATPSTHIFKLPLGTIGGGQGEPGGDSVVNEWLCSKLAAELGLPTARTEMARFDDQQVLIVERFDRSLSPDGTWWRRLPVEDFCQAQGLPPEKKYEMEGGPGIDTILQVLQGSELRQADREMFLRAQLVFWLLAAADGHAKNFSLFLGPRGTYRLTPLYDILSFHPWLGSTGARIPIQKLKVAMAVTGKNRHYEWSRIHRDHWAETAKRNGLADRFEDMSADLVKRVPLAIAAVEAQLATEVPSAVADAVFTGLTLTSRRLDASGKSLLP